jgi:hypothetical protein
MAIDRQISEERFSEMKELAEKSWRTETYRGPDSSSEVRIKLSDFGAIHRALLEAVHELERLYGERG